MSEEISIRMYHPEERSTGDYNVVRIAEFEYKLVENDPFNESLCYGTIIEVEKNLKEDGSYIFKRIVEESDFRLEIYGLNLGLNETELRKIGDLIAKNDGFWEVIFGGLAYVNLPKNSNFDVELEIKKLLDEKKKNN